jgi:hypothetical protein
MPTTKSTHYTAQEAAELDSSKLVSPSGSLEFRQIVYPLVGTEAANDIIKLARLPIGTTIIPALCSVLCEDPGTTLTLDIGTAEDTDGLADGIVLSAGGLVNFCSGTVPAFGLTKTPIASRDIQAVVASANTLTAGAKLVFNLAYTPARY